MRPQLVIHSGPHLPRQRRVAPQHPCSLVKPEMLLTGDSMDPGFDPSAIAVRQVESAAKKERLGVQVGGLEVVPVFPNPNPT